MSRERSCRRKLRHLDYLEAMRHAAEVPLNETVVIYPCVYCTGLHVGHSATPKARQHRPEPSGASAAIAKCQ